MAGVFVVICLLSFDSVESGCLNCEAPLGPYCCKTSFRGQCCEYPLPDRLPKSMAGLSPLARKMVEKQQQDELSKKHHGHAESRAGSISSPFRKADQA